VLEEADRWDVARQASWPEREDLLPGMLPAAQNEAPGPLPAGAAAAAAASGPPANADAAAGAAAAAEQQQLWVAQAESGPAAVTGSAAGAAVPLWQDPQFRFYELQVQHLHRQRSSASPAGADLLGIGLGPAEVALAAQLGAAGLGGSSAGGGAVGESWLESIPANPVLHPAQQHQQ
jgi:hypothetical protein